MRFQDLTETQNWDSSHLDKILLKLCKMIIDGQQTDSNQFGLVGAAVIDKNYNIVTSTSLSINNKWSHAERNAIEKYQEKYGNLPKDSIIVTTLSPCSDKMKDRYGLSCTDIINNTNIRYV